MKLSELQDILESTGLPVTFRAWPTERVPAMPYICYMPTRSNNFFADGKTYYKGQPVTVELYTELYAEEPRGTLEATLTAAGLGWQKETVYVETERFYLTYYEIEV